MICGQIKVYVGQTQFYNSSVNEKKGSTRFVLLHVYNKYIVLLSCVLSYFWKWNIFRYTCSSMCLCYA